MRKKLITMLAVPLIAALTAQAAAATEHRHARMKGRVAISKQFRDSNAYAAPAELAVPFNWPDYSEGAMTSGLAGH